MPNWTVDTFPISCWSKSDPILRSCDQYIWQVRPNNSPDASSFWSSRSRCTCISTRWSGSFPFSRPTESRWEKQFLCWIFCHTGWTGPEHNKLKRQLGSSHFKIGSQELKHHAVVATAFSVVVNPVILIWWLCTISMFSFLLPLFRCVSISSTYPTRWSLTDTFRFLWYFLWFHCVGVSGPLQRVRGWGGGFKNVS